MTTSQTDLDRKMATISKLLAVAEDPATTPEAAANYRAKAEELMRAYRIEEESLIATDQFKILPISKEIELLVGESDFRSHYVMMWYDIADHTGLRTIVRQRWDSEASRYRTVATAVGYGSDIRYAEFLWGASRLMFGSKIEPSVDPEASDQENIYRLRSAGIERNRISAIMWGESTHSGNAKVTRLYIRACAERGEDPAVAGRSVSAKDYRKVYAREFVARLDRRLRDARMAADSVGGAIELGGRKERVDEAFWTLYPTYRPAPASDAPTEPEKPCEACAKTTSKSGKCKIHRDYVMTRAERARIAREWTSETAQRASSAGRSAADSVKIDRVERAQRIEEPVASNGSAIEG